MKIEMLELRNRPQSKNSIIAGMLRWGYGDFNAAFDYAVDNGLLRQPKLSDWKKWYEDDRAIVVNEWYKQPKSACWIMTVKFESDAYLPTKEQIPNEVNL